MRHGGRGDRAVPARTARRRISLVARSSDGPGGVIGLAGSETEEGDDEASGRPLGRRVATWPRSWSLQPALADRGRRRRARRATTTAGSTADRSSDATLPAPPAAARVPGRRSAPTTATCVDQDGKPWHDERRLAAVHVGQPVRRRHGVLLRQPAGHGFNAAWVNLICGPYTARPRRRQHATTGSRRSRTDDDLATPNPDVLAADGHDGRRSPRSTASRCVLDPAETGTLRRPAEGATAPTRAGPTASSSARGTRTTPNIIWMLGNDYRDLEAYDKYVAAVAQGIRDADPTKLPDRSSSTRRCRPASTTRLWPPLIDINAAYAYTPTVRRRAAGLRRDADDAGVHGRGELRVREQRRRPEDERRVAAPPGVLDDDVRRDRPAVRQQVHVGVRRTTTGRSTSTRRPSTSTR